jgi:hypothetical protein
MKLRRKRLGALSHIFALLSISINSVAKQRQQQQHECFESETPRFGEK